MRDRRAGMKQNQPVFFGVGVASLVLILLLLCLVTFAILTYNSAASDLRLSQKAADRTTVWQEASNQAQSRIGEIDGCLEESWEQTGQAASYWKRASEKIGKLDWTDKEKCQVIQHAKSLTVTWQEMITQGQALYVRIRIGIPEDHQPYYTVESYQTRQTSEWKGDMSVNVYKKTGN